MPTCVATSSADDGSSGTLRATVARANANPGTTVTFSDGIAGRTMTLARERPLILGNGTVIDRGANHITIDGHGQYRASFVGNATSALTADVRIQAMEDATAEGGAGVTGGRDGDSAVRIAWLDKNLDLNGGHFLVA